jgi:MFS family permease
MASPSPNSDRGWKFVVRALRARNYRLFFFGQGVSLIGTAMQQLAMQWLVWDLTHQTFLLGFVVFAAMMPTSALTPFAGVLLDRWNRHRVIVITQSLALLQALLLGLLMMGGWINKDNVTWIVILLSAWLGIINAFDMPARQAFVVEMVERREDLGNAIALNSSLFNGAQLVGPMMAAVIYAAVGGAWCFLLNAISYVAVIIALLAMRLPRWEPRPGRQRGLHELREGAQYAFGFGPIRAILLLVAFTSLVGMPFMVLMPAFASQVFHGGIQTLGFLRAATAVGALLAAGYLASRRNVLGLGRVIVVGTALFGASLVAFSFTGHLGVALVMMLGTGMGRMVQTASCNTILQTLVDDDKRGRVMSFYAWCFMGMAPFGSLLAGYLGHTIGAPVTVMISGAGCMLAAGVFLLSLPEIQRLSRPVYRQRGILADVGDITGQEQVPNPPEE